MDYDNDCQSIFYEDITDKKKTGRGAFNKTSCTRKRNGGMPSDMLRGRKLKEYMGNSAVKTYNMYGSEKIDKRKRTKKTTSEDDAKICALYLDGEKIKSITELFKITPPVVYSVLKKNGIEKKSVKRTEFVPFDDHIDESDSGSVAWELQSDGETGSVAHKEPEHLAEEITLDYKWEYEYLQKKYALLKDENEKYKVALLNLALRMI